jgi:hypothetical protein
VTFDEIRIFQEARRTLKDLDITLEVKLAKKIFYIESLASRKRIRPRHPRKSNINIRCQSSFETHMSQLKKSTSAQVWGATAAAVATNYNFSLSGLDFLISLVFDNTGIPTEDEHLQ